MFTRITQLSREEGCVCVCVGQANVEVIKGVATRVAETQLACGMNTPVDEYLETLHFGLVEVVYEWACGMPFKQITGSYLGS